MWIFFVNLILRNRVVNLVVILALTVVMSFFAFNVKLSYEYAQMLPKKNPVNIQYQQFRETFKEDANIFFVGIKTDKMSQLDFFKEWVRLSKEIEQSYGVKSVFSIYNVFNLVRNEEKKQFDITPLFENIPDTQEEYTELHQQALNLQFYKDFIFIPEENVYTMLIGIKEEVLNSKERTDVIYDIKDIFIAFQNKHNIEFHYSGLPYIRTIISQKIKEELLLFLVLSIIVSMLVLLFFFRSFRAVILPICIVIIGVIWSLGTMVLLGYNISVLTGILPSILIIIGIENCIYILTRYHKEIQHHGGMARALTRVIQKVGYATLLTNITTAVGFGAFIVTGNVILVEFGIIAFISIILMFVFSIILIPILYSFFSPPKHRHIKHLKKNWVSFIYDGISIVITKHRRHVFILTGVLFVIGIIGLLKLEQKGTMVDDIPYKDPMYKDLLFFEKHLDGVLPFEISINTNKKNGLVDMNTIRKINDFQEMLKSFPEISKPLSYIEIIKFVKQSFYNGNPLMYDIPSNHERNFIFSYLPKMDSIGNSNLLASYVDSNMQIARVSARLVNLNTKEIKKLNADLRIKTDSIFSPDTYQVDITGTSVVFLKGSSYMMNNLIFSLVVAMIVISILMYLLFNSFKMVLISMVPNILPQIMTAALMGYLKIDIKPSTIIIYSIALGISVDAAIHLLSRYRQQLKATNWNIKLSLANALQETTVGMVYSGIVLILGFGVFTLSSFGGTQSLGFLVSFTLTIAMFSNLILLPSLILRFEKSGTTKAFAKPLIVILDEEEDAGTIETAQTSEEL